MNISGGPGLVLLVFFMAFLFTWFVPSGGGLIFCGALGLLLVLGLFHLYRVWTGRGD